MTMGKKNVKRKAIQFFVVSTVIFTFVLMLFGLRFGEAFLGSAILSALSTIYLRLTRKATDGRRQIKPKV